MTRTREYYDTVTTFREALRRIDREYKAELSGIEKYKGSIAYKNELRRIDKAKEEAVKQAQEIASSAFSKVLGGMMDAATSRPMIAPTQETLNLLQSLKMRSKISMEELRQAARTVEDCPLALSILDELAQEQGYMGLHFGKESTDSILKHIDSLTDSARKIARMEAVDRKREAVEAASVYSANYNPSALDSFRVDRDFDSEQDALAWLGGVVDYEVFTKAVN